MEDESRKGRYYYGNRKNQRRLLKHRSHSFGLYKQLVRIEHAHSVYRLSMSTEQTEDVTLIIAPDRLGSFARQQKHIENIASPEVLLLQDDLSEVPGRIFERF
jgi:hypothetical protein